MCFVKIGDIYITFFLKNQRLTFIEIYRFQALFWACQPFVSLYDSLSLPLSFSLLPSLPLPLCLFFCFLTWSMSRGKKKRKSSAPGTAVCFDKKLKHLEFALSFEMLSNILDYGLFHLVAGISYFFQLERNKLPVSSASTKCSFGKACPWWHFFTPAHPLSSMALTLQNLP